jgi:hypothetical protein
VTLGTLAFYGASIAALVTAWRLVCAGAPSHRSIAAATTLSVAASIIHPIAVADGASLLTRRAIFVAFPSISAWCAAASLLGPTLHQRGRRAWALGCFLAWLAFVGVAAQINPPRSSPAAEQIALASRLASLLVELGIVIVFALRRKRPTFTQTIALVLVAGDLGELAGPWLWPSAWHAWELARVQWAGVYLLIATLQDRRRRWIRTLAAR